MHMKYHLGSNDQSTKENTFTSPLLKPDVNMWLYALDINEGNESHGHLNLGSFNYIIYECGEGGCL